MSSLKVGMVILESAQDLKSSTLSKLTQCFECVLVHVKGRVHAGRHLIGWLIGVLTEQQLRMTGLFQFLYQSA